MPPEAATNWLEIVSNLGATGVLAWFVWYLVTKHLPKLEDRHREERGQLVAAIQEKDDKHDQVVAAFNRTMQRSIEVQAESNNRIGGLEKSIEQLPEIIKEHSR